jgi:site-specific DNA recombinase
LQYRRLENTGLFCDARTVLESKIEEILVKAINTTLKSRDTFLATLQNNIATVLGRENDAAIEDIEKKIEEMQIQLLKLASARADIKQVTDEITVCAMRSRRHW